MRRFLSGLIITVLVFSMVACSSTTSDPKSAVSGYLDALKSGNIESMDKYIKPDSDNEVKEVFNDENEGNSEAFLKAYNKLEYKILNSQVDGDTAIVEVEINAPNLGKVMTEFMQEALSIAFASAFSENKSEDEMDDLMNTLLMDKMTSEDLPMLKKTVKIDLIKENDVWIITPSDDLTDALTGNLASISNLFN